MSPSAAKRSVRDSLVQMTEIVLPEDSNSRGSIFGGRVLALVDKCAAVVALRHARSQVATIRLDSVEFKKPVHVGDILLLCGRINAAFGTSMEIEVEVQAENPLTGERRQTTRAFVTFVATDAEGRPTAVPRLELATPEERRRERRLLDRQADEA